MALVAAAMVLGGGSSSPGLELALQLAFAAIVLLTALAVAVRPDWAEPSRTPPAVLALAGLVLVLPLLQLVPLPPALWQALPGRGDELAALQLADAGQRWMPFSKTPARTLASLLAMIVPVALMVMVARLDTAGRTRVLAVIVAMAIASVMLGTLQLADGEGGRWRLQAQTHLTYLTGFQANRNHQADVLSIAVLAAAACWVALRRSDASRRRESGLKLRRIALLVAFPLLAFGALMTGSRAGLALAVLAWGAATLMVRPITSWRGTAKWVVAAVVAGAVSAAALLQLPAVQRVALRFSEDGANRSALWADTRKAIALHWPAGGGVGSFQPVFIAAETLDNVDTTMPVRAHNDWLELTLENGVAGWVVMSAITILLAWQAFISARRLPPGRLSGPSERAQLLFGVTTLVMLALHSLVDYPIRSMSLACLAGVAAAMLFTRPDLPRAQAVNEPA